MYIYNYYKDQKRKCMALVGIWPGLLEIRAEILGLSAAPAAYGGFPKWGVPKNRWFTVENHGKSIYKWMIWRYPRYPDFRKPPYGFSMLHIHMKYTFSMLFLYLSIL